VDECKPLSVGAKVNVRDRWGGTPLENAVIVGQEAGAYTRPLFGST